MKKSPILFLVFFISRVCTAQETDSSALIFNDTVINDFRISFYIPEWHDSLIANKANGETYLPARFVWHAPDGDSIVLDSIGVRYKGNSSYNVASEKRPFKFYFNKYRKDQLFFSLEKLNFSNGVGDPTLLREKISYDILAKYMPSPRACFATLTVEDSLTGSLYTQVEQVDELFLKRHFDNDNDNLYKTGDQGATLTYKSPNQTDYDADYELKTNGKENDWSGLITLLYHLNNSEDPDFVHCVGKLLDLDNCIRYLAFNMVNMNFDSYTGSSRNYYLYDDRDGGLFKLIPWDLNMSFGVYEYTWGSNLVNVNAFAPTNLDQRPLTRRIVQNDSLKRVYASYIKEMINGPMNADSVKVLAHRYRDVIDSAVSADTKKFFTYEQFSTNVDTELVTKEGIQIAILPGLVSFTRARAENLLAQVESILAVDEHQIRSNSPKGVSMHCIPSVNGILTLDYNIPVSGTPIIRLYNPKGMMLQTVEEGKKRRGTHRAYLNTRDFSPGYYVVVLFTGTAIHSTGVFLNKR